MKRTNNGIIIRSFESDGKKYLYGYAAIFDSPDAHGTVMTKKLVEANTSRLRKFPAVHFMHKTALGQLVWDQEVKGVSTFIDEHGFHVLVRVYDECDKEWGMIRRGNWGFSYAVLPSKMGRVCFSASDCHPSFEEGVMYEISVVDSPSHIEATAMILRRKEQRFTMRDFTKYEVDQAGNIIGVVEPIKEPKPNPIEPTPLCLIALRNLDSPNPEESWRKESFPAICSEACPHRTCAYFNSEHFGRPCAMLYEPYKHESEQQGKLPAKRTLSRFEEYLAEKTENIPDHHVLQFEPDSSTFKPAIIKGKHSTFRLGTLSD